MVKDVLFKVKTPIGVLIHTTEEYWRRIVTEKHPSIVKYESQVKDTLSSSDEIRRSTQDPRVHLYYKSIGKLDM